MQRENVPCGECHDGDPVFAQHRFHLCVLKAILDHALDSGREVAHKGRMFDSKTEPLFPLAADVCLKITQRYGRTPDQGRSRTVSSLRDTDTLRPVRHVHLCPVVGRQGEVIGEAVGGRESFEVSEYRNLHEALDGSQRQGSAYLQASLPKSVAMLHSNKEVLRASELVAGRNPTCLFSVSVICFPTIGVSARAADRRRRSLM